MQPNGSLTMFTHSLNLNDLLREIDELKPYSWTLAVEPI